MMPENNSQLTCVHSHVRVSKRLDCVKQIFSEAFFVGHNLDQSYSSSQCSLFHPGLNPQAQMDINKAIEQACDTV